MHSEFRPRRSRALSSPSDELALLKARLRDGGSAIRVRHLMRDAISMHFSRHDCVMGATPLHSPSSPRKLCSLSSPLSLSMESMTTIGGRESVSFIAASISNAAAGEGLN